MTQKVILKTPQFLIILLHITIIYALEIIYMYCICVVEILLHNGGCYCASLFKPHIQRCQVSSLTLALVGVFIPQKSANATIKAFSS